MSQIHNTFTQVFKSVRNSKNNRAQLLIIFLNVLMSLCESVEEQLELQGVAKRSLSINTSEEVPKKEVLCSYQFPCGECDDYVESECKYEWKLRP